MMKNKQTATCENKNPISLTRKRKFYLNWFRNKMNMKIMIPLLVVIILIAFFLTDKDNGENLSDFETKSVKNNDIPRFENELVKLEKLNEKYHDANDPKEIQHCIEKGITTTGGFCVSKNDIKKGGNELWCKKLGQAITEVVEKKTVLVLGAGLGHYENYWISDFPIEKRPSHMYSCDGGYGINIATKDFAHQVGYCDLTKPLYFGMYDWILCLEVGEHIPKEFEKKVLYNIIRYAKEGVILSWAVEGQGGYHHVNNRNNDYIISAMEGYFFTYDEKESIKLRNLATLRWFRNTIMVFRNQKKLEKLLLQEICDHSPLHETAHSLIKMSTLC